MKIKTDKIYSPNFNLKKRKLSQIKYIIIHYTGMVNERKAIEKLTNIQVNEGVPFGQGNYGKLMEKLMKDVDG